MTLEPGILGAKYKLTRNSAKYASATDNLDISHTRLAWTSSPSYLLASIRKAAIEALQGQAGLTEEVLQRIAARLEDSDSDVRQATIGALQGQAGLPEEVLQSHPPLSHNRNSTKSSTGYPSASSPFYKRLK
ncbi:hypothetical protein B0T26DRAFT_678254 [Lasiosphaeria miniovina]|uniref:HEAT repeat domain-containing protein n=1 Tax=Lasiosphaeria miniovina TaxID=1954250 RepID=A0AA40ADL9_9PEZI|nr:uncharacterized protein B0T26DRAFT_678254 [Lasiosphaeria miniovina]KAK0713982.1 hypothetical protein B0T26DRAFT_678254 [Lasiosphaeria miniovina]